MRLPLLELRRRPGRFVVATVVLAFLATLLLFLGGLLDGLYLGSTGAIRAQQADAIVFSASARESFLRSRITPEERSAVEAAPGVEEVGGIGFVLLGAQVPGETDLADVAVAGYEIPPQGVPAPPADGEGIADSRLEDAGASKGDTILVGPAQTPITIIGFVDDTSYLLQSTVWVNLATWREVQNANRPDAALAPDVVQALVVSGTGDLPASIDTATAGATTTLTLDESVLALPGVKQQRDTFNQIIYSTLVVVLAVVGLFFSLLTLERLGLYGVLKAIGASHTPAVRRRGAAGCHRRHHCVRRGLAACRWRGSGATGPGAVAADPGTIPVDVHRARRRRSPGQRHFATQGHQGRPGLSHR